MSGGKFISKDCEVFFLWNMALRARLKTLDQRSIVAIAMQMLEAQKLNKLLWVEAVANAVYTLNRCSMKALRSITPEETWDGRRPYIAHMPMFGSIVKVMVMDKKNGKLYVKEIKYVFLGNCKGIKAYKLMCLETQKIHKK